MFCHGRHESHCCYIQGEVCSNLLEGDQIQTFLDELLESFGEVTPFVQKLYEDLGRGPNFACLIPLEITAISILENGELPDKETIIDNWLTHIKYGPIADKWVELKLPYSYCTDYGPKQGQCCFSETYTVNYERANEIPVSVRGLRRFV